MQSTHTNTLFILFILLLSANPAQAKPNENNILSAARGGNFELVSELIKNKTIPKDQGLLNNVLAQSIIAKDKEIFELAITKGADVNHKSALDTPILIDTIMQNRPDFALMLLDRGADPNVRGYDQIHQELRVHWDWTALMCASWMGQLNIIESLIEKGADPMAIGWSTDEDELESSADIAAYSGHLEALKHLIELNVPIHEHTFYKVARSGHTEVLEYMLPYLKDINQPGPFRGRPLIIEAAWWGQFDVVQLLLDKGADINATDAYGYSAISEITDQMIDDPAMQIKMAQFLIDHGADLNLPSKTDIRPYDRAVHNGNEDLRLLFKENGAEPTLMEN